MDAQGLSYADTVGNLDHASLAESIGAEIFSNPSSSVGSRPVNFGAVFAWESTSTMSSPSSIGIHNDLPASQTGIPIWPSSDEFPRRIKYVSGINQPLFRDCRFNHNIDEVFFYLFVSNIGVVLAWDEDGVNSLGDDIVIFVFVFDGYLNFGIRSDPGY